jgi:large subunit ribosomal protein L30
MKRIRIEQIKSGIGRTMRQKLTLQALGLRKMHQVVEHDATPQIMGMVTKVRHLVKCEEI